MSHTQAPDLPLHSLRPLFLSLFLSLLLQPLFQMPSPLCSLFLLLLNLKLSTLLPTSGLWHSASVNTLHHHPPKAAPPSLSPFSSSLSLLPPQPPQSPHGPLQNQNPNALAPQCLKFLPNMKGPPKQPTLLHQIESHSRTLSLPLPLPTKESLENYSLWEGKFDKLVKLWLLSYFAPLLGVHILERFLCPSPIQKTKVFSSPEFFVLNFCAEKKEKEAFLSLHSPLPFPPPPTTLLPPWRGRQHLWEVVCIFWFAQQFSIQHQSGTEKRHLQKYEH